jgi:hypothetical protein
MKDIDDKMRWEAPGQHPPRFVFMDGASCLYYFVLFSLFDPFDLPPLPLVTIKQWSLVQKISMHDDDDDDDHDMLAMDAFSFLQWQLLWLSERLFAFALPIRAALFPDSAWVTTHARW